jgi:PPM family protein phosphatase
VLDIAVASRSETGERDINEDRVRVCREGARWLAVVADGAGGHVGGAEASRRAVDHLEAALHEGNPSFTADALTAAVLSAHADVMRAQPWAEGRARMHSTVVVLWIDASTDSALWSHVGDSRLYRARRGRVDLLTADDSIVQRMVDAGLLTPQQAQVHPQKNQLIAALGIDDAVEPHTLVQPVAIEEGDAFLLCSDGWWGSLQPGCIESTLLHADTPEEWLAAMLAEIQRQSAPHQDNFSAIGVWVGDGDEATRPMLPLAP